MRIILGHFSQARAREILAAAARSQQRGSEGVKVNRLIQTVQEFSVDPFNKDTRFSDYNPSVVPNGCPVRIPGPPAPPLRPCVPKNSKFFGQ
jgi:hypothetical protein